MTSRFFSTLERKMISLFYWRHKSTAYKGDQAFPTSMAHIIRIQKDIHHSLCNEVIRGYKRHAMQDSGMAWFNKNSVGRNGNILYRYGWVQTWLEQRNLRNLPFWQRKLWRNHTKKQLATEYGILASTSVSNTNCELFAGAYILLFTWKIFIFVIFLCSWQNLNPVVVVKYVFPCSTTRVTAIIESKFNEV